MTLVTHIVLVLHLLGMAAIIGSWLVTRHELRVTPALLWGARAQLVTGIILVGLLQASPDPGDKPNNVKLGVKLVVALAVVACAEIANARQRRATSPAATSPAATSPAATVGAAAGRGSSTAVVAPAAPGLVQAAALLAILNVFVAVLWT